MTWYCLDVSLTFFRRIYIYSYKRETFATGVDQWYDPGCCYMLLLLLWTWGYCASLRFSGLTWSPWALCHPYLGVPYGSLWHDMSSCGSSHWVSDVDPVGAIGHHNSSWASFRITVLWLTDHNRSTLWILLVHSMDPYGSYSSYSTFSHHDAPNGRMVLPVPFFPPRHLRASREGPGGLPEGHRVHHSSDGCRACQLLHSRGEDGKVGRIF